MKVGFVRGLPDLDVSIAINTAVRQGVNFCKASLHQRMSRKSAEMAPRAGPESLESAGMRRKLATSPLSFMAFQISSLLSAMRRCMEVGAVGSSREIRVSR